MLGVERLHVLIKSLSEHGTKNLMVTFQKKYEVFRQAQVQWRHASNHEWSTKRSIWNKQPLQEEKNCVVLKGKLKKRTVTEVEMKYLQDQWAVRSKPYDVFKDSYGTYVKNCNSRKVIPATFANWNPLGSRVPRNEEEQKKRDEQMKWQSMESTVWDVERLEMDGVLFRTQPSQDRKHSKTDNSCLIGWVNTHGREANSRQVRVEKCYGRIVRLFLHFMHPLSSRELECATEKGNLDPNKIPAHVPWAVFAECTWYEVIGTNPKTKLVQVQYNPHWSEGRCPYISMDHCISENCSMWPSVPYDDNKYDKAGTLKVGQVDVQDYSTHRHDVIRKP
jgi:hypothetical protein